MSNIICILKYVTLAKNDNDIALRLAFS